MYKGLLIFACLFQAVPQLEFELVHTHIPAIKMDWNQKVRPSYAAYVFLVGENLALVGSDGFLILKNKQN